MIVSFTGHRPHPKLGGYKLPNPIYNYVVAELRRILNEIKPTKAISGMALGYDQWAAQACIDLNIPFIAAVPFQGQERIWPEESKIQYFSLLEKSAEVKIVSEGGYLGAKMDIRNRWMVDNSDLVIAAFDGVPSGGTFNCVSYANSKKRKIIIIDPNKAL